MRRWSNSVGFAFVASRLRMTEVGALARQTLLAYGVP